jgi:hypothetical protein
VRRLILAREASGRPIVGAEPHKKEPSGTSEGQAPQPEPIRSAGPIEEEVCVLKGVCMDVYVFVSMKWCCFDYQHGL